MRRELVIFIRDKGRGTGDEGRESRRTIIFVGDKDGCQGAREGN